MADKSLVYTVRLDASQAQAQAAQLRSLFQAELSHIQFSLLDPGALKFGMVAGHENKRSTKSRVAWR